MSPLLAHHIEGQHVPVLLALLVAGLYIGWSLTSRVLDAPLETRRARSSELIGSFHPCPPRSSASGSSGLMARRFISSPSGHT